MNIELTIDIGLRIATGLVLGAAIGFERQWRSRTAGVRTNALVSLGAALFVVMGAFSFGTGDPTRVAAQIVSGIGFLGAGVIMKQGSSITGLNTAATLWASAAVGALAGGGMYLAAAGGTIAVMIANVVLRPVGRFLDRRGHAQQEHTATEYSFEVSCRTDAEVLVRSLVFDAVQRPEFIVQSIAARDEPETDTVHISAMVVASERNDRELEAAIHEVIRTPEVLSVRWRAVALTGAD